MAEEMEKINEIFRLHEEKEKTASQKKIEDSALHKAASASQRTGAVPAQAPEEGEEPGEYSEEELTERDFQPVRRGRELFSSPASVSSWRAWPGCPRQTLLH